jgi:hypothetical protein
MREGRYLLEFWMFLLLYLTLLASYFLMLGIALAGLAAVVRKRK